MTLVLEARATVALGLGLGLGLGLKLSFNLKGNREWEVGSKFVDGISYRRVVAVSVYTSMFICKLTHFFNHQFIVEVLVARFGNPHKGSNCLARHL